MMDPIRKMIRIFQEKIASMMVNIKSVNTEKRIVREDVVINDSTRL